MRAVLLTTDDELPVAVNSDLVIAVLPPTGGDNDRSASVMVTILFAGMTNPLFVLESFDDTVAALNR